MDTCGRPECQIKTSAPLCRAHTKDELRLRLAGMTAEQRQAQAARSAVKGLAASKQARLSSAPAREDPCARRRAVRERLLEEQHYRCALCGADQDQKEREWWDLDHAHDNGLIREVLCRRCNGGMWAVDNDEWLSLAIAYRDKWRAEHQANGGMTY